MNKNIDIEKIKMILGFKIMVDLKILKLDKACKYLEISTPTFRKYTKLYKLDTKTGKLSKMKCNLT